MSSNFINDMGSRTSKYAVSFSYMNALPKNNLKHENPTKILHQMPLLDKYKEVMGPDPKKLVKHDKIKKAILKKKSTKEKLQKEKEIKEKRKEEEKKEVQSLPTSIFLDQDDRIRDEKGKIINLSVRKSQNFD